MKDKSKPSDLKSVKGNSPLRSRGFLSHGSSQSEGGEIKRKSTGMRSHSGKGTGPDGKGLAPSELNQIKPKRDYELK